MKQRWDKFVDDTRRRLRQLNPRNRVRHRPTYVCGHIEYLSYTPVQYDNSTHIKTHGSESRGQEEAACMRVFWPTRPLQ